MARELTKKSIVEGPDETRLYERARLDYAQVGDLSVVRGVVEPGWRWTVDVRPNAGTDLCQVLHRGLIIGGRMGIEMAAGQTTELMPGDVYEIPPGHDAWVIGGEPLIMYDVSMEMAEFGLPVAGERVLATLLFTDIVGSTTLLEQAGDLEWRRRLSQHDSAIRSEVDRYRGRVVNTTGDGVLAAFDGAARAIHAAVAIRRALHQLELPVRIGIHTGEVEQLGTEVRGVAVHATARIMSLAGADEILVSDLTRQLAAGSGLTFVDRGEFELRGLNDRVRLFAAAS